MPRFVRGLWQHPEIAWPRKKFAAEIALAATHFDKLPTVIYVVTPTTAPSLECPDWDVRQLPLPVKPLPHARAMWWYKLKIIEAALEDCGEVVWMDWDVRLLAQDLPAGFWDRLRQGACIQTPLLRLRRSRCYWRSVPDGRHCYSVGSWVYCRDLAVMQEILANWDAWTAENPGIPWEEYCIMRWIDQQEGGWQSVEHYCKAGYEPFCVAPRRSAVPRDSAWWAAKVPCFSIGC